MEFTPGTLPPTYKYLKKPFGYAYVMTLKSGESGFRLSTHLQTKSAIVYRQIAD